jgi:hypothetical protein
MQLRMFVASLAIIVATATPVLAAEFWVSQKPANKKCKIVGAMPDGKTYVMIGATSYPTKEEAQAAMQVAIDAGQCVKKKSSRGYLSQTRSRAHSHPAATLLRFVPWSSA